MRGSSLLSCLSLSSRCQVWRTLGSRALCSLSIQPCLRPHSRREGSVPPHPVSEKPQDLVSAGAKRWVCSQRQSSLRPWKWRLPWFTSTEGETGSKRAQEGRKLGHATCPGTQVLTEDHAFVSSAFNGLSRWHLPDPALTPSLTV